VKGRKPLPTELKKSSGTYRRDRANADEPAGEPCLPRCPSHLKGEARKTWDRTGKALLAIRVMTAADWAALSMFCTTWARHVEAEAKIAELGAVVRGATGGAVVSPWVTISAKAIEQATRLAVELGMTPSARGRVKIVPKQQTFSVSSRPRSSAHEYLATHFPDRN
jgi:P27 family predicted phage terminase small subunit